MMNAADPSSVAAAAKVLLSSKAAPVPRSEVAEAGLRRVDQFETIVSDHYEPLYKFAMSLTRAESDARDLTQHTFYIWAKKGHQLRDISKVKTWLFTTLHRAFLEARRRQTRFPHLQLEEVSEQLPAFSPELGDHLDSSEVLTALANVDEVFQSAVALFYLEDCSYKDIAAILEVPIGTVKSRIARGIGQLREILLSDGSAPERDYTEWDLSSTLLGEQCGVV